MSSVLRGLWLTIVIWELESEKPPTSSKNLLRCGISEGTKSDILFSPRSCTPINHGKVDMAFSISLITDWYRLM